MAGKGLTSDKAFGQPVSQRSTIENDLCEPNMILKKRFKIVKSVHVCGKSAKIFFFVSDG